MIIGIDIDNTLTESSKVFNKYLKNIAKKKNRKCKYIQADSWKELDYLVEEMEHGR